MKKKHSNKKRSEINKYLFLYENEIENSIYKKVQKLFEDTSYFLYICKAQ